MNMKSLLISLPLAVCCLLPATAQTAGCGCDSCPAAIRDTALATSRYQRHTDRYKSFWQRLTPRQTTLQYAGSIGLLSAGVGWHYGPRDQWETEFLVGFLPRYERERTSATFTLKQRFRPWVIPVSHRWEIDPLTTGLFFNTISGENFWSREPSRYPKRYYGFSTRIRTHVFLGQRLRYNIPTRNRLYNKSITFYYELSTCDLYLVSAIPNSNVRLSDILSLCFGVRMEVF